MIPLQGVAVAVSILKCPPVEAGAAYSYGSDAGDQERGSAIKKFSGHFSCHQLFPGIPVVSVATAVVDSSGFDPLIALLSSLFFPEQPQRPPLLIRV